MVEQIAMFAAVVKPISVHSLQGTEQSKFNTTSVRKEGMASDPDTPTIKNKKFHVGDKVHCNSIQSPFLPGLKALDPQSIEIQYFKRSKFFDQQQTFQWLLSTFNTLPSHRTFDWLQLNFKPFAAFFIFDNNSLTFTAI